MKALKCDRCGKYFDYDENIDNYICTGNKSIKSDNIEVGFEFDLCPKCIKEIMNEMGCDYRLNSNE